MEIFGSTICFVFDPVFRRIRYPFVYKRNLQDLHIEVDILKDMRDRVQHSVLEDERNGRLIVREVVHWLEDVDRIIEQQATAEERAKKRCFKIGFCPNLFTRYQLSKKAEKEALAIAELRHGGKFVSISYCDVPQIMSALSHDMAFQSRNSIFEKIMNAVESPDVRMIGVHGMAGVGKTTMLRQVARKVMEIRLFDAVVMSTVTQSPDVSKIQGEIAAMLGLALEEESEWGRAARIHRRLKLERILVVLDDLWDQIELEAIGIPLNDGHKGCKILLASRDFNVLSTIMDCQQIFQLEVLYEQEAWDLFNNKAGGNFENHDQQSIAKEVAMACSGLPVAIVSIASALRQKSLSEWKNALRELRNPSPKNFTGIQKAVYFSIELSYKHLTREELRLTFLLCSLMGHSASIRNLFIYGIGLGLFRSSNSLGEARDSMYSWLQQLRASCLISLDGNTLAVHDVVRNVAVSIASRDYHVLSANNEIRLNQFDGDELKMTTQIWLQNCSVIKLPEGMVWPQLELLRITSDNQCHTLQDSTFKGMEKLKVLDLNNFSSSSLLPFSLILCQNLRTLCLDQLMLEDISIIGELKTLEVLTFVRSNIKHLPREICQLTRLKLLDLSGCSQLEAIPQNVISNLSHLEELYMGDSFHQWENGGGKKAGIFELENLAYLTSLEIHIQDSQLLSEAMFIDRLLRFRIFVGDVWNWDGESKTLKSLKIKCDISGGPLEYGIQMLLESTEDLHLIDQMYDAENVFNMLDMKGFPRLKYLHLHNCHEIHYIANVMDNRAPSVVFPLLESMILHNLLSLERICYGSVSLLSFRSLRILMVENCDQLQSLFPFSVAQGILQLQEVKIKNCPNMEEVVTRGREESYSVAVIKFNELRSISLQDLPRFRSFGSKVKESCLPQTRPTARLSSCTASEEIISKDEQPIPKQLFHDKIEFPNLEELKVHSMKIERLWHGHHPEITVSTQNLVKLDVEECGSLKCIFSSSMIKSLMQLKHLSIRSCMSMKEIIASEQEEETITTILFPNLEDIILLNLQKLKHFCTGSVIKCPLLKRLCISGCHDMKAFISDFDENLHNSMQPFFDEKVVFPCLTDVEIHGLNYLEKLWPNQFAQGSFCKLTSVKITDCKKLVNLFEMKLQENDDEIQVYYPLQFRDLDLLRLPKLKHVHVSGCHALKNLFPFSVARDLDELGVLEIQKCHGVEAIVAAEGDLVPRFLFPQLISLKLRDLPELRNFYPRRHKWECPMLKSLEVSNCGNKYSKKFHNRQEIQRQDQPDSPIQPPLFSFEKVILNLEELSLSSGGLSMSVIGCCQLPVEYDFKLKVLRLKNIEKSSSIPFHFLRRLGNLETLSVEDSSFEKIFLFEEFVEEDHTAAMLPRLENLSIQAVHGLRHLWEKHHPLSHAFQMLGNLEVRFCSDFVSLASSSASFRNLLTLNVSFCDELLHLITSSTAKSLVQLIKLVVYECYKVTEIVAKDEDVADDEIVFHKLEFLELSGLENLRSFCPGNYIFKFPSLKEMVVNKCPKLMNFSPIEPIMPNLQGMRWQTSQLNTTTQPLYTEMVPCYNIGHLNLSDVPSLKERWHGELSPNFCSNLRSLTVGECAFDFSAIPSNLLQVMNGLALLNVTNCGFLKVIFDLEGLIGEERHARLLPNLEELMLIDLPNLRHICNENPQGILDFKNLKTLVIRNCSSLRNIFTESMALNLVVLSTIQIRNCAMMEEIISNDIAEGEAVDKIRFPALKVIVLESLPNLTSICSGTGIASLEEVSIDNCPNMKAFIFSILREQEPDPITEGKELIVGTGDHDITTTTLPNPKVAFANLKKLRVEWDSIMEVIQHGQIQAEFFCKLEILELIHFPNHYVDFPSHFLQRFINLENLALSNASFEEIVLYKKTNSREKHMKVLAQLKALKLSKLPKLVRLSMNDSAQPCPVLQILKTLDVSECAGLKILVPSSVSFHSLKSLNVTRCHGLINLMTASAVKHLVQLKEMAIVECDMIEEILAEEVEAENEVIFHKLEWLHLDCLQKLESFNSGNLTFTFPSLELVLVKKCPKMKCFSRGVKSTPLLKSVLLEDKYYEDLNWEDKLDDTNQKMSRNMDDGGSVSKLPISVKQPRAESNPADKSGVSAVSEKLASEDMHVTQNPDTNIDLPLSTESVLETKEKTIKGDFKEPEITQIPLKYQDNGVNISISLKIPTPMDVATGISLQVQKDPQANDHKVQVIPASSILQNVAPQVQVIPASSSQQTSTAPFSLATTVEQPSSSILASLIQATSSHKGIESPSSTTQQLVRSSPASSSTDGLRANTSAESHYLNDVNSESYGNSMALLKRIALEILNEVARSENGLSLLSSLRNSQNPHAIKDFLPEVDNTVKLTIENEASGNVFVDPQIAYPVSTGQDSRGTSNAKDSTHKQNFLTTITAETHIFPQVEMSPSEVDKDQEKFASSVEQSGKVPTSPATALEQPSTSDSASPNKTDTSQQIKSENSESLFGSKEQWLKSSQASSLYSPSSSDSHPEFHESTGASFDYYMSLLKEILMKPLTEVARSDDALLLLSTLKNLQNFRLLNDQQSEIIQIYIDDFDSLVSNHPFYEQQIDRTNTLEQSIEDDKKGITEIETHNSDLTRRTRSVSAEKEASKNRLHEIDEEEDRRIHADMEGLYAQLVTRKAKLRTRMDALPEAVRQQREAKDRAANAKDHWAKLRSLFV